MSTVNDAWDVLQSGQWFGFNTTVTYCTFGSRERIGALTYTRCAATSGTRRIRERRNPTAAASHFTPSRRTCRPPAAREMSGGDRGRGPRRRNDPGRLPFPGPSGFHVDLPSSDRLVEMQTLRLWAAWRASAGAETRGSAPRCAIKDARRTPVPPTKDGTGREF